VEANIAHWEYKSIEFSRKYNEAKLYQKPLVVLTSVYPWAYLSMGITSQFGTNLKIVILWTIGFCLIFAFAYTVFNKDSFTTIVKDRQMRIRLAETPSLSNTEEELPPQKQHRDIKGFKYFIFCLTFSFNSFAKIGYGDIRLKSLNASKTLRLLVWIQWLLGHGWYILILYTLLNTVPILKGLLF
jgi:hypothetical protein